MSRILKERERLDLPFESSLLFCGADQEKEFCESLFLLLESLQFGFEFLFLLVLFVADDIGDASRQINTRKLKDEKINKHRETLKQSSRKNQENLRLLKKKMKKMKKMKRSESCAISH